MFYSFLLIFVSYILTIDCNPSPLYGVYLGCYRDDPISRDLPDLKILALLTIDSCVSTCAAQKYAYAGLQYSSECFCGNSYGKFGVLTERECNFKCVGNSSQFCGGSLSNSIYAIKNLPDSLNSNPSSSTPTNLQPTTPNWSIFYEPSFFSNKPASRQQDNIPILEIVSSPRSPLNLYSKVDYYRSHSRLEVSTMSDSITSKKSINLSLNLTSSTSLVVVWLRPHLSLFVNCQLLIKVDFIKSSDSQALSLPFYQPETLNSHGGVVQSQSECFAQAGCSREQDPQPSSFSSSSSLLNRIETPVLMPSSSLSPEDKSSPVITFSEWGVLLRSNLFPKITGSMTLPLRVFELVDDKIYASGLFYQTNQTFEVSILIDSIFTRRVLKINSPSTSNSSTAAGAQLDLANIDTILIAWTIPNLYVFINCELVAQFGFADAGQQAVMSIPYFKKNVVLSAGFFDSIQEMFARTSCPAPDFLFTSTSSTSTTTTATTTMTTTSQQESSTITALQATLKSSNSFAKNSEWSIYFSNGLFSNHPGKLIRLLEVLDETSGVFVLVDYYTLESSLEVEIVVDNSSFKKSAFILAAADESRPISTFILSWKYPDLMITINCVRSAQLQFRSMSEARALATPSLDPDSVRTPGYRSQSIEQTYFQAGCVTRSPPQANSNNLYYSTIYDTTTTTTTTTTTPQLPSDILGERQNRVNFHEDEKRVIAQPSASSSSSSIPTIPDGDNIDFNNFDSNFILTVYNTRILQYQNLIKLQQIFKDYNYIDLLAYNLTFYDC